MATPAFITNLTRSSSRMSSSGLPATAIKSAALFGAIEPIQESDPIRAAPLIVAARRISSGLNPSAA
jgi:hypothetical protein